MKLDYKYLAIVPVFIGSGALYWFTRNGEPPHVPDADNRGGSGAMLAPGLRTSHSGIRVNARQIVFAIEMRKLCDYSKVPMLVITSGIRDEYGQARAMLAYLKRYGATADTRTAEGAKEGTDLTKLYKGAATELMQLAQTEDVWADKIVELYRRGLLKYGGHYIPSKPNAAESVKLLGGAIDFAEGDNAEIIRAAKAVGAKAAYDDGPCVHVEIP